MIVSKIPTDNIRNFRVEDPAFGLLAALDRDYKRHSLLAVTNPDSEDGTVTYFSHKVISDGVEFRSCTCSAFRYSLPKANDVLSGEASLSDVRDNPCKHLRAIQGKPEGGEKAGEESEAPTDSYREQRHESLESLYQ